MANFNLSKLMEGKNPQAVMLAETRQLKSKWEATGLLEGLKEREQSQIAVLLENQAKQLLDEATATGTSAGSEEWSGVALPLVRRIFGEIAAKEFVSVQPMNLPSGLIFYLDFKYGTAVAGATKFNGQSLFGGSGTSAFDGDFGRTKSAVNGLYGEGRYSYTINDQSITVAAGNAVTSSATWADVNYDSSLSASVEAGTLKKITIAKSNISTAADFDAVRSYHISASSFSAADAFYPAHTEVVGSNVVFYANLMPNGGTNAAVVKYSLAPTSITRGDFEDGVSNGAITEPATDLGIPEVDLELRSEAIVAKTRKLKAVWTPELAQDLNAYHSIDAEAELTSMLSEYISLEIDLEILDMLKSNALTTEYWSATVGEELINGVWTGGNQSLAYQKNTWFQTLGVKLNKVSNKIHQLTLRGGANFIVASPDVCTILESIPGFSVNADKDATSFAAGVSQVGSLASRYTVYKNPYMTSNEILLGFKGSNFLETGAVYAPYVPLIMTPLVYDPSNFTPRRGVMTRYAKKMVRPEFYGKIYVKDLASI
jgi:flagellin-like hook-associated protein FlgL